MTKDITIIIARIFYDGIPIGAALWMGTAIVRDAIRELRMNKGDEVLLRD